MTTQGTLRLEAARGVMWLTAQRWGLRLSSFATFLLLARLLEPEDFGVVAIASVCIAVLNALAEFGLTGYLIRRHAMSRQVACTGFWISVTIGTSLALVLVLAASLVARGLGEDALAGPLRAMSLNIVFGAMAIAPTALLTREMRFKAQAVRASAAAGIGGLASVGAALTGMGVWSLVIQANVTAFCNVVLVWVASSWRPSLQVDRQEIRPMLIYGGRVVWLQLLGQVRNRADDFIVGAVLGSHSLGVYVVAKRLVTLVGELFSSVLTQVAMPIFARIRGDLDRLRRAYLNAVGATSILALFAFVSLALAANEVTVLLFGRSWERAGDIAGMLALSGAVSSLAGLDRGVLLVLHRERLELGVTLFMAVSQVITASLAAPFGLEAVALAVLARTYVTWPVRWWASRKATGMPVGAVLRTIAPIWGSALLAAVSASATSHALLDRAVSVWAVPVYIPVFLVLLHFFAKSLWLAMWTILARGIRCVGGPLSQTRSAYEPGRSAHG